MQKFRVHAGVGKRPRLYVSDLDGTLLDRHAKLSDFARASLTSLLERGIAFTIATGRSAPAVRQILGALPTAMPIVEQNGACVTDLSTGRRLAVHDIPPTHAEVIVTHFRRAGVDPVVSSLAGQQIAVSYERLGNSGTRWFVDEKRGVADVLLQELADVSAVFESPVLSFSTYAEEGALRRLAGALIDELASDVQVRLGRHGYMPDWWELCVLDRRATKASGIRVLRSALGLDAAELVVFGDAENDTDMFLQADHPIAVENAIPELRALAKEIVGSNDVDGVIHWLLGQHSLT